MDPVESARWKVGKALDKIDVDFSYATAMDIRENQHLLTDEERQAVAEYDYSKFAWLATLKWRDWHASNAFGGPRTGKSKKILLEELEETRKWLEENLNVKLGKIKTPEGYTPCTQEYYDSVWAEIDKRREERENA